MTALVQVVSPADYLAWLQRQSQLIQTANSQVTQLRSYLMRTGNL
jgi:heme/copper-type cytochrome/quinol oxidase subunit 2